MLFIETRCLIAALSMHQNALPLLTNAARQLFRDQERSAVDANEGKMHLRALAGRTITFLMHLINFVECRAAIHV